LDLGLIFNSGIPAQMPKWVYVTQGKGLVLYTVTILKLFYDKLVFGSYLYTITHTLEPNKAEMVNFLMDHII
jgi:hypothetical protein